MYPTLGAAGSHYARSVVPVIMKPAILPDPSLLFDSMLLLNPVVKWVMLTLASLDGT
jgi:hypothetical protein